MFQNSRRQKGYALLNELRMLISRGFVDIAPSVQGHYQMASEAHYTNLGNKIVEFVLTDPDRARRHLPTLLPLIELSRESRGDLQREQAKKK